MKAMVVFLVLLVVGLTVGGGLYYKHASEIEAGLRADLEIANKHLALANERGDTLLETTNKRLASTKERGDTLSEELSLAKEETVLLTNELAQVKSNLSEKAAEGEQSAKRSDVLAGLLSRKNDVELLNEELIAAIFTISESQKAFATNPSAATFSGFKSALGSVLTITDRSKPMLEDLTLYLRNNKVHLSGSVGLVADTEQRVASVRGMASKAEAAFRPCLSSCREAKLGVSSQEGWQTADITMSKNEVFAFEGAGQWTYAPSQQSAVGPHGEDWIVDYRVEPEAPNGAILGRIHGSEGAYLTGAGLADRDGRLEFRINDTLLSDNSGTIDVMIWAFKPASWGE